MATKKIKVTKDRIVSLYMDYVLEHSEKPKSVYIFSKMNDFSETEFYAFFGTIESIEKEIFKMFVEKTVDLLNLNQEYVMYDMKSKMLSFYFTFFEILTANRSYVVLVLKEHNNNLKKLSLLAGLKLSFKNYLIEIITDDFRTQQERLQNFQEKAFQESSWFQLLLTMKFWLDDSSPSFEKTDIYIEKSVKANFELMNIAPIDSLIDFGKFIFKEKIYNK
ncbi:DNA-binding transcriptional regulator, AcrR family [Flavobacterium segetis]|uniref:DNA-binding transcriptional regulator, AcrR family n=1 Tax=Flavobacterium segetis TaxID=271157 RepID=A0A1M5EEZ7_9FLAO|nr:TetR family transcriptional regulator C-terminal domain-containing protein [Flavobacterium segetis]SHF77795.1 DNA-binding transcriptional regulator, AcrR family [Flavobacterium segetis]